MVNIRKPKNALKFTQPASWWGSTWREALPTGNGVIGAAVYGGAGNEVVLINHADLWWQGRVGVLRDVADKLPTVRKKMDEGSVKDAEHIFQNALIGQGYRPQLSYPLPLCDFHVDMHLEKPAKEYARILNMENGEIGVTFKDGATRYERSMFVSRAKNLIAYEITRVGNKAIDVKFSLELHDRFNVRTPNAVSKLPDGVNIKYDKHLMYFSARSDNGTDFGVVGLIHYYGGEQVVESDGVTVKGASSVLVLLAPFVESQREKEWKATKDRLASVKATYDKLLKEHTPLHAKLFSRAEVDFDASGRELPTDDLLRKAFTEGEADAALYEKLWAFGRYLTVCGTSPDSVPLAPYGLWCGDFKAPNSQIMADGSLQTCYAHVLTGNMPEYLESVFRYYENVLEDLRKNASRLYGCRGLFIPSVMAHGTGVLGSVESKVIHFTGVAGWISQLFYDYYRYTDDVKFLKTRALPFMKEVALFYENFFKRLGDSMYDSCPSYSPNTTPLNYVVGGAETLEIARNATIDFAIAKELLQNLVEGSKIAGTNKSDWIKWEDMLTRIPSYQQTEDGLIREYADAHFADNYTSQSTAMFYPVFPGTEITSDNPEMHKAFHATARKKAAGCYRERTGMALSRYANIFARLGDGETAADIIGTLVRNMAMGNLVFASSDWRGMGAGTHEIWANYSVESNAGVTSAIQEMLLQSDAKSIRLLPALPSVLSKGSVSGMLTRTGVEVVELDWDKRKGVVLVKLKSRKATTINVVLPQGAKRYKPSGAEKVDLEQGIVSDLVLPAGKVLSMDIRF